MLKNRIVYIRSGISSSKNKTDFTNLTTNYISTNLEALQKLLDENDIDDLVYDAIERGDMRINGDWEVPSFGGWTTKNFWVNGTDPECLVQND